MDSVYSLTQMERRRKNVFLNDKDMKEYEGDILVYEGEYCMNDYDVLRNGNGVVFCSSNHFYTAVFENGIEKMKMKEINGNEMVYYDNKGRVLYRGEYEKKGNDYLIIMFFT